MNLSLFNELAGELGFTVDFSESNVFEAHKGDITFHINGNFYFAWTNVKGARFFKFYTADTVEAKGLQQLEDAVQILS